MSEEEFAADKLNLPVVPEVSAHAEPRDGAPPPALSPGEIREKLGRLPGLVAIGVLTPAKANSMRAVYDSLLRSLEGTATSTSRTVADADALFILRQHPELLRLMEPFLSQDQVALVVQEAENDA